jgi:hypothetical protein
MVTAAAARTGETEQTLVIDLPFPAQEGLARSLGPTWSSPESIIPRPRMRSACS